MSFFAYTIYGVAITPALLAALAWKRATKAGGLASIISGTVVCLIFFILSKVLPAAQVPDGDPWGIPLIYPALIASLGAAGHRQPPDAEAQARGAGEVLPEAEGN